MTTGRLERRHSAPRKSQPTRALGRLLCATCGRLRHAFEGALATVPSTNAGSKPAGNKDLGDVLVGVFADAIHRAGAGPQHGPRQVVRVPVDHRIEELDGRTLVCSSSSASSRYCRVSAIVRSASSSSSLFW
jgi:hypothetical protein